MLNKERRHPIEVFLGNDSRAPKKRVATNKLINFKINKELAEDFKIYCKLHYTDLTAQLVTYIMAKVDKSREEIEEHKKNSQ